jgi:hypothetical protein
MSVIGMKGLPNHFSCVSISINRVSWIHPIPSSTKTLDISFPPLALDALEDWHLGS